MFEEHAMKCYPEEACALVYDNEIHLVPNISHDKLNMFKIPVSDMLKAYRSSTGLQAILHSHPDGSSEASDYDLEQLNNTLCEWRIYSVRDNTWSSYEPKQNHLSRCS